MATTQGYPRKDRIPLHLAVKGSCISQSDEEQSFEYIEQTVHSMAELVRRSIARSRVAPYERPIARRSRLNKTYFMSRG